MSNTTCNHAGEIRLQATVQDSIVDGPGLRYVLFAQGCPHECEGCHNPETHAFEGGCFRSIDALIKEIRGNPLLSGITLSGGEPFEQAEGFVDLCARVRGMGLSIWAYSGYTFEQLAVSPGRRELLALCDVLVDGPFVLAQRSLALPFRGSRNQRVIDVQASLSHGRVVSWEAPAWSIA